MMMLMVVVVVVVIGKYTGWHVKKWNIVLYVDRAVSQSVSEMFSIGHCSEGRSC